MSSVSLIDGHIDEMTDNEIINALECCTTKGAKCSDCPAFKKVDRSDCKKYFRGAIDIINRQQAEIERLTKETMNMAVTIETCQSEAIKEFWGKLKKHSRKMQSSDFSGEFWDRAVLVEDGDNLLKEMVVETE